jgi:hypothetical protein
MSRRSSEARQGKKRENGLSNHSGSWLGFVDLPLMEEEKQSLAAMSLEDCPDLLAFLERAIADGYKVSLVGDEKHSCVIMTLTGRGEGCENAGYSLSARGPDLVGALLVLDYKHRVICEEGRWLGHEETRGSQLSLWS